MVDPISRAGNGRSGTVLLAAPLRNLVAFAYRVENDQVTGPSWMNTEIYAVSANIPAAATEEQFHLMLRNLLAARFQMTLHHETKVMDGYDLVVAKGGPNERGPRAAGRRSGAGDGRRSCVFWTGWRELDV